MKGRAVFFRVVFWVENPGVEILLRWLHYQDVTSGIEYAKRKNTIEAFCRK